MGHSSSPQDTAKQLRNESVEAWRHDIDLYQLGRFLRPTFNEYSNSTLALMGIYLYRLHVYIIYIILYTQQFSPRG